MMTGMAHLLSQAKGGEVPGSKKWPLDRVLAVTIPLLGKTYFIGPDGQIVDNGPACMLVNCYSELYDKDGRPLGVAHHEEIGIVMTGIVTEVTGMPKWWEARNN